MKLLLLKIIRAYQDLTRAGISTPFFLGAYSGCRSWPTCSEFAYEQITTQGVVVGVMHATKRVLRCHSFSVATTHHS